MVLHVQGWSAAACCKSQRELYRISMLCGQDGGINQRRVLYWYAANVLHAHTNSLARASPHGHFAPPSCVHTHTCGCRACNEFGSCTHMLDYGFRRLTLPHWSQPNRCSGTICWQGFLRRILRLCAPSRTMQRTGERKRERPK